MQSLLQSICAGEASLSLSLSLSVGESVRGKETRREQLTSGKLLRKHLDLPVHQPCMRGYMLLERMARLAPLDPLFTLTRPQAQAQVEAGHMHTRASDFPLSQPKQQQQRLSLGSRDETSHSASNAACSL